MPEIVEGTHALKILDTDSLWLKELFSVVQISKTRCKAWHKDSRAI